MILTRYGLHGEGHSLFLIVDYVSVHEKTSPRAKCFQDIIIYMHDLFRDQGHILLLMVHYVDVHFTINFVGLIIF